MTDTMFRVLIFSLVVATTLAMSYDDLQYDQDRHYVDTSYQYSPSPSYGSSGSQYGYGQSYSYSQPSYGVRQQRRSQSYGYSQPGYGHQQQQQTSYSYQSPSYSYQQPSYGYQQQSYGNQQQSYGNQQTGYGHQQSSYGTQQPSYGYQSPSYGYQQPSYGYQDNYGVPQHRQYGKSSGYDISHGSSYSQQQPSTYEPVSYEKTKVITKKVYVPIVVRKKKEKKKKTIAEYHGFYIPGGTQMFGKFKNMKSCQKACEITPSCFAGDYNPWVKKCYIHTNTTACGRMRAHKSIKHFKKIPCQLVETTRGLITPGAQLFNGIQQKGVKSLSDCLKKCATAGGGIAPTPAAVATTPQLCFGIDYDFATHKCYFHVTAENICPTDVDPITTPVNLVANPSVVNIIICPLTSA